MATRSEAIAVRINEHTDKRDDAELLTMTFYAVEELAATFARDEDLWILFRAEVEDARKQKEESL